MPWSIQKRDGKYCVVKQDSTSPVPGGCHASRVDALKHQRALYANEPSARTASVAPIKPPKSWFERAEALNPTPLTITSDGEVFGHLALWDTCHVGFLNGSYTECIKPPRSQNGYSSFHLAPIETEEGDLVNIGKLTFDTSHAPLTANLQAASSHYDQTGAVGAFVRARDGRHGIWVSGALRSDLPAEGLRDLRANPPSGDWRALNHNLELIAALAVPVPGFPIQRSQLSLSAAASGDVEVTTLILPGLTPDEVPAPLSAPEFLAELNAITAAVLTTKKRKSLARSSYAIPETRSYPIHDLSHARNALARSSGKPEAARVRRAVCRKFPQLCKS